MLRKEALDVWAYGVELEADVRKPTCDGAKVKRSARHKSRSPLYAVIPCYRGGGYVSNFFSKYQEPEK